MKIMKVSGNNLSRLLFYLINPFIKSAIKIYIPQNYEKMTVDSLNQALCDFLNKSDQPESITHKNKARKIRYAESFQPTVPDHLKLENESFSYRHSNELKMLRIVSPFSLNLNTDPLKEFEPKECDAILIHIHGGGFISQTSSQHQIYLRRWSKQLGIPVLMLSYTLCPEAEYPDALNECWQSYMWIIDNLETSLGLKPKKILLSGDSAGGNLAVALAGLTICKGVRVPDGLIPLYPCLLLSQTRFSPSRVFAFDDHLLNYLMIS